MRDRRVLHVLGVAWLASGLAACGGSGGTASPAVPSQVAPAVAPSPSPAPTPTPTPAPGPSPSPSPELNDRPVAKVVIKIEFIDCPATGEANLTGPFNWTSLGCRIHMDLTPRDVYNRPTDGAKGNPDWHFNDPGLVTVRDGSSYTPVLRAEQTGHLSIQGELDGVRSNTVQIWLY